ncbi:hypothetical protein EDC04DRAFT_3091843 [Pisolithus marmoratus]|nr:hypothetical protein EDC04DRAFT_3091843 [Pisolithus marmoratus]
MIALASPIGNWLTGGDHVKNALLLFLLVYYLHQIIEVPWSLYHLSRPRRRSYPQSEDASTQDRYASIASSELRVFELFYLALTVLSPFLPSHSSSLLLRYDLGTISFHVLRRRVTDLHDLVHYPPSEVEKAQERLILLTEKVALLETQLKATQARLEARKLVKRWKGVYGGRRKKSEAAKSAHEARLSRLEKDVELLLEKREIRADAVSPTLLSSLEEQLKAFKPYLTAGNQRATSPSRSRSCSKSGLCRSPPISLETIPERATFQPVVHAPSSPFRIPGLKLFLGIGDLVTLPLRYLIAYLVSGKVPSLRGSALFP